MRLCLAFPPSLRDRETYWVGSPDKRNRNRRWFLAAKRPGLWADVSVQRNWAPEEGTPDAPPLPRVASAQTATELFQQRPRPPTGGATGRAALGGREGCGRVLGSALQVPSALGLGFLTCRPR